MKCKECWSCLILNNGENGSTYQCLGTRDNNDIHPYFDAEQTCIFEDNDGEV